MTPWQIEVLTNLALLMLFGMGAALGWLIGYGMGWRDGTKRREQLP